ncbi:hypothetical protein N7451_012866 [Penicillium sp. IBT 35674x]|nr:hypothetical protein N7451_012866 [Penicillium sp. IBT 35674x]
MLGESGQPSGAGSAASLTSQDPGTPNHLTDEQPSNVSMNGHHASMDVSRMHQILPRVAGSGLGESGDGRGPTNPYYDEMTRAVAAGPGYSRDLLFQLIEAVQQADCTYAQKLLDMVEHRRPVQQLHAYISGILATAGMGFPSTAISDPALHNARC